MEGVGGGLAVYLIMSGGDIAFTGRLELLSISTPLDCFVLGASNSTVDRWRVGRWRGKGIRHLLF